MKRRTLRLRRLLALHLGGCLVALGLGSGDVLGQSSKATRTEDATVVRVVQAHNKEREKQGLPPLTLEALLTDAARAHARDMAEHETMSHDGSDGSKPFERVQRSGYRYRNTGENVAFGTFGIPGLMQIWMDSPPHKKNILEESFTEIGVGYQKGASGRTYWCVEFGRPMPRFEPGVASAELIKKINAERNKANKPPLVADSRLIRAACDRSAQFAKSGTSTPRASAEIDGVDRKLYPQVAVSSARGQADADAMIQALTDDPKLKEQILGKYVRIGAGYAVDAEGVPFWCVILANPARR